MKINFTKNGQGDPSFPGFYTPSDIDITVFALNEHSGIVVESKSLVFPVGRFRDDWTSFTGSSWRRVNGSVTFEE